MSTPMSDDFDPSPRPSKRRKTYASNRTILNSPEGSRAFSGVSSALSSLSNRLLGRSKQLLESVLHDDSAYGSKEDSLNEDEIVVAEGEVEVGVEAEVGDVQEEQDENNTVPVRGTRKSSRKSVELKDPSQSKTSEARRGNPEAVRKSRQRNDQVPSEDKPERAEAESGTRRRPTRKSLLMEAQSDARQQEERKAVDVQHMTDKKRKPKAQAVKVDISEPIETKAGQEADTTQPIDRLDGSDVEETIEPEQRSSGRQRRRPRRFSVETAPAKEPEPARAAAQHEAVISPAKASSAVASPQLKGILTPSRRRREGPPKSVVFHESGKTIEERLGFKDIESSGNKPKKAAKKSAEIPEAPQSAEEDEDDLFLDRNPPQDILQTLELPSRSTDLTKHDQSEDTPAVTAIKTLILSRLTSNSLPSSSPPHLSTQYSTLRSLLASTIAAGESNSLLLLGSRGCGKSMLIDTALAGLSSEHKDDFHIVSLNGFFQTDDRLALREIWRQLGREREAIGEVEENDTMEVSGSYADTMASLLSLLSHPDDFDQDPNAMDLDAPPNQAKASKSVVIVLDEFDLFTLHPRQTLLYNLFDIAQSKKAPIAVIGCSTRIDVVECLEKRVKSRFSHRWIHVPSIKSVEGMREAVERVLCLDDGKDAEVEFEDRERWNEYIKSSFLPSQQVQALIQQTFYTTKSLPDLLAALYIPIAILSLPAIASATTTPSSTNKVSKAKTKSKSASKAATITTSPRATTTTSIPPTTPPSSLTLLPHLPTLHLSLLIAAARLETIFALTHTNLNATYTHYLELLQRSKAHSHSTFASSSSVGIRQWGKETCLSAWEDLIRWEVLTPVVGGREEVEWGAGGGREELSVRMVRVDVALEEVGWGIKEKFAGMGDGEVVGKGVGEVLGRWCREE